MTTIKTTVLLLLALMGTHLASGQAEMQVAIQENGVQLDWTASAEATSFVVEMATDVDENGHLQYGEVAFLEASNSSSSTYKVEEVEASGLVYFRVKQFDRWGNEIASHSNTANYLLKDNFTSNISASPDFSKLYVDINATAPSTADIVINTATGKEEYRGLFAAQQGLNTFDIPLEPSLADGFYIVTVTCNNASQNVLLEKEVAPSFMVTVD